MDCAVDDTDDAFLNEQKQTFLALVARPDSHGLVYMVAGFFRLNGLTSNAATQLDSTSLTPPSSLSPLSVITTTTTATTTTVV